MYEQLEANLRRKGWSEEEINHAIAMLEKGEDDKSPIIQFLDKAVYWFALIFAIVGNFVLAVVLVPFLLTSQNLWIYLVVIIFGVFFGLLYRNLLYDIEQVSGKQVIVGSLFLPSIALIAMYIMARLGYELALFIGLPTPVETPIAVSIVYVLGFILPYFLYRT